MQTAVAAAKVTFAMALFATEALLAPLAVALIAFTVYNANDLSDRDEDAINRPAMADFADRHAGAIAVVAGVAGLAAIVLATASAGPVGGALVLVPVVAGAIYSLPLVPVGGHDRIKEVYVLNSAVVAAAWAITVAGLPAVVSGDVSPAAALVVCVYFFLRTFVSVEVFNVRDVAGDRASGVETLPVRLGLAETRTVLFGLDLVSLGVLATAGSLVGLSQTAILAAVPVTALSIGLTAFVGRCPDRDLLCLAKDAEYLVLGVAGLCAM